MADEAQIAAPVVENAIPEAPKPVVEVDIPADGGFPAEGPSEEEKTALANAGKEAEEAAAALEAKKAEESKPVKKSPYQARIDALTAQRAEKDRQIAEQAKELELYKAMAEGRTAPALEDGTPAPAAQTYATKADFDRAVSEHAKQIAAQDAAKSRTDKLLGSGNSEYKDFTERCNVVAALGAGDRPDFMQIVTDPEVIPDGHKMIAALADKPEEAARILALPTVQMTAALVKFQAENSKAPAPKPMSAVPAPIKTIDGAARTNDEPSDRDSMAEYARKYKALQAKKRADGQPARFAKH